MSDPDGPAPEDASERDEAAEDAGAAEPAWKRRKRLAEVFGDVLPDTTSDERDEQAGRGGTSEEWLRRQVPPHHG